MQAIPNESKPETCTFNHKAIAARSRRKHDRLNPIRSSVGLLTLLWCSAGFYWMWRCSTLFFFTWFGLSLFTLNILLHWHFYSLLLHWVDVWELCLTMQPLALLQSQLLTAASFHLPPFSFPQFTILCMLAYLQHTNVCMFSNPCWPLCHRTGSKEVFLFSPEYAFVHSVQGLFQIQLWQIT